MAKAKTKSKTKTKTKTKRSWRKNWNDKDLTKAARDNLEGVNIPRGKKAAAVVKEKKRLEKEWIKSAKEYERGVRTPGPAHHAAYD